MLISVVSSSLCLFYRLPEDAAYRGGTPTHLGRLEAVDHSVKNRARPVTDRAVLEHPNAVAAHDKAGVASRRCIERRETTPLVVADGL